MYYNFFFQKKGFSQFEGGAYAGDSTFFSSSSFLFFFCVLGDAAVLVMSMSMSVSMSMSMSMSVSMSMWHLSFFYLTLPLGPGGSYSFHILCSSFFVLVFDLDP